MRLLVASRHDPASINIRDRLLETGDWQPTGERFRGALAWGRGDDLLVEIEGPSVTDEDLAGHLRAWRDAVEAVWFLSRHRAESGHPSLTVHPIGNHRPVADLGGRPSTLAPAPARDMGALLRRLKARRDEAGLPHSVTFEATHHGPGIGVPSLFVEIGSDDAWYGDRRTAQAMAAAVHDVLDGGGAIGGPVLVGAGGGHYVPRQTDLALAGEADFGHFLPAYAVDADDADSGMLARAVVATPGCEGLHLHRKGLRGAQRSRVLQWAEALGVKVWNAD